ncbi:MAG: hypothetical protein HUJ30_04240 [Gammaproteobacteria bacterium]|nr:hypothetical protein [Gammaproteobacteria bacterium]
MKNTYLNAAIFISIAFWFTESTLHYYIFDQQSGFEIIPSDSNELWMRIVICILLIIFGVFIERDVKNRIKSEKEKNDVYFATVSASQHVINNFLNNTYLIKEKAKEEGAFTTELDKELEALIHQTSKELGQLEFVDELTSEKIIMSVYPKK